jgi:hypothetical protein
MRVRAAKVLYAALFDDSTCGPRALRCSFVPSNPAYLLQEGLYRLLHLFATGEGESDRVPVN